MISTQIHPERQAGAPAAKRGGVGRQLLGGRYLAFLAVVATVGALALKSELLPGRLVWAAGGILILWTVSGLAFLHFWNRGARLLTIDHYIPPVMAILAACAFSLLTSDWKAHVVVALGAGAIIFANGYADLWRSLGWEKPGHRFLQDASLVAIVFALFLVIQAAPVGVPLKLGWITLAAFATGYRSFSVATPGEWRALSYGLQVAFAVGAVALALLTYLPQQGYEAAGAFVAVVLLLVWYVIRGLIVHGLEESLNKNVIFEYGLMGGIAVYLVVTLLLNR
jgi:hypothetical protein